MVFLLGLRQSASAAECLSCRPYGSANHAEHNRNRPGGGLERSKGRAQRIHRGRGARRCGAGRYLRGGHAGQFADKSRELHAIQRLFDVRNGIYQLASGNKQRSDGRRDARHGDHRLLRGRRHLREPFEHIVGPGQRLGRYRQQLLAKAYAQLLNLLRGHPGLVGHAVAGPGKVALGVRRLGHDVLIAQLHQLGLAHLVDGLGDALRPGVLLEIGLGHDEAQRFERLGFAGINACQRGLRPLHRYVLEGGHIGRQLHKACGHLHALLSYNPHAHAHIAKERSGVQGRLLGQTHALDGGIGPRHHGLLVLPEGFADLVHGFIHVAGQLDGRYPGGGHGDGHGSGQRFPCANHPVRDLSPAIARRFGMAGHSLEIFFAGFRRAFGRRFHLIHRLAGFAGHPLEARCVAGQRDVQFGYGLCIRHPMISSFRPAASARPFDPART